MINLFSHQVFSAGRYWSFLAGLGLLLLGQAQAQVNDVAQVRSFLEDVIPIQTVKGKGQVPELANYIKLRLEESGFEPEDVVIERVGETAYLFARYRGRTDASPILIAAHMDVVDVNLDGWRSDPFEITERDGFLIGRGVLDNKFGIAVTVTVLGRLKREGFVPDRDIVLVLSGDEETDMNTTALLSQRFEDAEILLNADSGGGVLRSDGTPMTYVLQTAEKIYADFKIVATAEGGHSSRPTQNNAIYSLARATLRLSELKFPLRYNETTLMFFNKTGEEIGGRLGQAMIDFSQDPNDVDAAMRIAQEVNYAPQLRTTCVATQAKAGHAINALPRDAELFVNCRVFPGDEVEDVRAAIVSAIDDPSINVELLTKNPVGGDASPLRDDLVRALRAALANRHKGLSITPEMSAGQTDSAFFRQVGVPSYGISGVFIDPADDLVHGPNERIPLDTIAGALEHWHILLTELAGEPSG